jgi:hypothetical protein
MRDEPMTRRSGLGAIRCGNGVAGRGSYPADFRGRKDHIDDASLE